MCCFQISPGDILTHRANLFGGVFYFWQLILFFQTVNYCSETGNALFFSSKKHRLTDLWAKLCSAGKTINLNVFRRKKIYIYCKNLQLMGKVNGPFLQALKWEERGEGKCSNALTFQSHKKWFLNELKTIFIFTFQMQRMICVNNLQRGRRVSCVWVTPYSVSMEIHFDMQ